jgi:UDP-glucuronate 4-epimerase
MTAQTEILVTGGAGFIGSHLVDQLMNEGCWNVTVYDNFDSSYPASNKLSNINIHKRDPRFELIIADIHDEERLARYFRQRKPEVVVHLAARTGVRPSLGNSVPYMDANVRGTLKLLEVIRRFEVRTFIYASSSAVYGARDQLPFKEDVGPSPISPYGMSKAAGELVCHTYSHLYNLRSICLRIFSTYGERQRPDLAIHKFANLIVGGKPIPAYGIGKVRDYVYVGDIVAGIRGAMDFSDSMFEVINLGGVEAIELGYLINLLAEKLETTAVVHRLPLQPGDQPHAVSDNSKARRLIGYVPQMRFEEGITRFVDWFLQVQASNLRDLETFRRARRAGTN